MDSTDSGTGSLTGNSPGGPPSAVSGTGSSQHSRIFLLNRTAVSCCTLATIDSAYSGSNSQSQRSGHNKCTSESASFGGSSVGGCSGGMGLPSGLNSRRNLQRSTNGIFRSVTESSAERRVVQAAALKHTELPPNKGTVNTLFNFKMRDPFKLLRTFIASLIRKK